MSVYVCVCACTCHGVRMNVREQIAVLTSLVIWILEMQRGLPGLAANTFTGRAIMHPIA